MAPTRDQRRPAASLDPYAAPSAQLRGRDFDDPEQGQLHAGRLDGYVGRKEDSVRMLDRALTMVGWRGRGVMVVRVDMAVVASSVDVVMIIVDVVMVIVVEVVDVVMVIVVVVEIVPVIFGVVSVSVSTGFVLRSLVARCEVHDPERAMHVIESMVQTVQERQQQGGPTPGCQQAHTQSAPTAPIACMS